MPTTKLGLIPREISWLSFNARVLQEAQDETTPLIDRIKFLGIFSNNRDEFFRVRVANLKRLAMLKNHHYDTSIAKAVLEKVQKITLQQEKQFEKAFQNVIKALKDHNIHLLRETELTAEQGQFVRNYFRDEVEANLVPIMLSQAPKFPHLREGGIYLAVVLQQNNIQAKPEYALIELPTTLPRFVQLPSQGHSEYLIFLDDVIRYCLNDLFAVFNYTNNAAYTIKLSRDAELDIDSDIAKDFLAQLEKSIALRKHGQPVRLTYDEALPEHFLNFFIQALSFSKHDTIIAGGRYHNLKDLMTFPAIGSKSLKYHHIDSIDHPQIKPNKSMLQLIAQQDILLHFPYHSFEYFIDLLREASMDPDVKEIKITLYRVAKEKSKVAHVLMNAARNGKKVIAVIELRARFDEAINIDLTNQLTEAGVKVILGVPGLKVHSKLCLITKHAKNGPEQVACIGTGNFNENTAKVYVDTLLLTSHPDITNEVNKVFHFFKSNYKHYKFKHLLLAPFQFRQKFLKLIQQEIKNTKAGKPASIMIKVNGLTDEEVIRKLYKASQAGVQVKLIIRGECSLLPGVKNLSENIDAISIVDHYLEHSRIFIFNNNNNPLYYISSANLMVRNIDYRVEATCPIYDPNLQKQLADIMKITLSDNVKARIIDSKQTNPYKRTAGKKIRSQQAIRTYLEQL